MLRRRQVEHPISAGGVVYRVLDGRLEIALCGLKTPPLWALPKGTPEVGETMEQTALREVREETGLEVAIRMPLGSIQYWFVRTQDGVRCHKTVHFYLMVPTGGDTSLHDPEFDFVRWFPGRETMKVMTYDDEKAIVEKALSLTRSETAHL